MGSILLLSPLLGEPLYRGEYHRSILLPNPLKGTLRIRPDPDPLTLVSFRVSRLIAIFCICDYRFLEIFLDFCCDELFAFTCSICYLDRINLRGSSWVNLFS